MQNPFAYLLIDGVRNNTGRMGTKDAAFLILCRENKVMRASELCDLMIKVQNSLSCTKILKEGMVSAHRPDGTLFDLPRLVAKNIDREIEVSGNSRFCKVYQTT